MEVSDYAFKRVVNLNYHKLYFLVILFNQGPGVLECDAVKKGLLSRVVEGIFECTKSSDDTSKYSIKLSMVLFTQPYVIGLNKSFFIFN